MKLNTSGFLKKSQFPLLIALSTLPLMALTILQNAPSALPSLSLLVPAYVLLAWLCMILPGKVRVAGGALGCALLVLLSLHLLPFSVIVSAVDAYTLSLDQRVFLLIVPILLCAQLVYSLQFAAWPRDREIAFNWYAVGLLIHLFVQLISHIERRKGAPAWESAQPWLLASFIALLMLVLLSMNRITMISASLGRQSIPPSMRRKNTAFTLALLGIALVIAAIPAIARFLEHLGDALLRGIGALLRFLAGLFEQEAVATGSGMGGASMLPPAIGSEEPGLLAKLLELLATLLALAALVAFAVFFVRFLARKLAELLRYLHQQLRQYMTSASQDYVDEITDTREDGGETQGTLIDRLRRRMPFASERRLTPTERVRYRYRLLLRRHPDWHRSRTARENLRAQAAELYERARYSGQEISAEEAEQFSSETKHS